MEGYTLVTGATGGRGEEFCRQLAARGDRLFLTGRSPERLAALSGRLAAEFHAVQTDFFPCMLDDEKQRAALFADIDAKGVRISRLVYVAGVDTQLAFEKYDQQKLLFQTRVNFEAAVSTARYAMERRTQDFGILVVGSMSSACPMPYFALYSATKIAICYFFSALRTELKGSAKVTVVMPGGVPTRPDIIEDIKRQGLKGRLSAKPKAFVVKKALAGAEKNKRIVIPGLFNKFTYFITKIVPVSWQTAFVAKHWSGREKDAFTRRDR